MKMVITRYEFLVRAVDPIAHHEESIGNMSVFMRKRMMLPNGQVQRVPYLTGGHWVTFKRPYGQHTNPAARLP